MNTNTTLIIIASIVVAAGAYWYFFTRTGNEPPLSALSVENQAQTKFQTLLGELNPVSFDTGIFLDPRFMALVDLATPVAPETTGRLDPFAPVAPITPISGVIKQ